MNPLVHCRIDRTGSHESSSIVCEGPNAILSASKIDDVNDVIARAEAAAKEGHLVVGFVRYDAAPAFDPALIVMTPATNPTLPFAWFGVFSQWGTDGSPPLEETSESDAFPWRCDIDRDAHQQGVATIRSLIAAGVTYLVNFTTRFRRPWGEGESAALFYQRLRAQYASGLHVFIETPEWAVACASPERFFTLVGDHLTVQPMKGTTPRGRSATDDHSQARQLQTSTKEQSENVMVVDLFRNDLGRIATPGSIDVPALCQVERHPTMWQMTSSVRARVRPTVSFVDIFASLFPSASVTGAPKAATMGAIASVETSPRELYCGAIGYLHRDRDDPTGVGVRADFSVAIRTATIDKVRGEVTYGAGGGITWESTAATEWQELLLKSAVLRDPPGRQPMPNGLFETMRSVTSAIPAVVAVHNFTEHIHRLRASADYFSFTVPNDIATRVEDFAQASGDARLRVTLFRDGEVRLESFPLPVAATAPLRLCVDPHPVNQESVLLFHKTTDRTEYEVRALRHRSADDVVIVNERGEVTETTRANIVVQRDGQWWTPALSSGLLPGVERERLLRAGAIRERVIVLDDLRNAQGLATINSLRGWQVAELLLDGCGCRGVE